EGVVDLEVGGLRVLCRRRRGAGDVTVALRPRVDAARVDEKGKARQRLATGEGEDKALARLHREPDAERRDQVRRGRPGGDRDCRPGQLRSAGKLHAAVEHAGNLAGDELDAEGARLAP